MIVHHLCFVHFCISVFVTALTVPYAAEVTQFPAGMFSLVYIMHRSMQVSAV